MKPEIKKDWLERAREHQAADRFIQGKWLNGMVGDFSSGCFFGCMTQTDENTIERASEEMNSPQWIGYLAERIFEGLPKEEALLFPVQYMENIPDELTEDQYESMRHNLAILRMRRLLDIVGEIETEEDHKQEVINSINLTIDYHNHPTESAARSAESAAWSAARSAAWSAESAAWSAAWSAESAARSAARSAESAAWSAAESAAFIQERDDLFSVFSQASLEHEQ